MFIKHHLGQKLDKLVTVDTNKEFVELGQQYFGFTPNCEVIESIIDDAYTYVKQCSTNTFDLVFVDVCYETASAEGVSPPQQFLSPDFIESLQNILTANGVCAINTMIRNEETKKAIFSKISQVKDSVKFKSKCTEDLNEVVYLSKGLKSETSSKIRNSQL